MNRVDGGGVFFWGPVLAIPMWAVIITICSMLLGCTTLPTTYRVPLYRTQSQESRLPYTDINCDTAVTLTATLTRE
jgi:hypothetical protein